MADYVGRVPVLTEATCSPPVQPRLPHAWDPTEQPTPLSQILTLVEAELGTHLNISPLLLE